MPLLSVAERTKIACAYMECGRNAAKAARMLNTAQAISHKIGNSTVLRVAKKFFETGNLNDRNRSGRRRSTTDVLSASSIIQITTKNPQFSIREVANECGTSRYAVQRVLKEEKFKPYTVRYLQIL